MKLPNKISILFCITYLLGANYCYADLGETADQIIARYGDPQVERNYDDEHSDKGVQYSFITASLFVFVSIEKGLSVREIISKLNKTSFSDTEIEDILNRNLPKNQIWKKVFDEDMSKTWIRSDGAMMIYTFPHGKRAVIQLSIHPGKK